MRNTNKCKVENCNNIIFESEYCAKHWSQLRRNGKILERTVRDRNEIIIRDDFAEIILYNKDQTEKARAIIDIEDIILVKDYKWSLRKDNNYVAGSKNGEKILLHRIILNAKNNIQIDHINRNKLDNRKSNLRLCDAKDNRKNNSKDRRNKSGINGVYLDKRIDKWRAVLILNHKKIYLGSSYSLEEAIQMRINGEKIYYGEFAPIHYDEV